MFRIFNRQSSLRFSFDNRHLLIDVNRLKQDECVIIQYDKNGNPVTIQKLQTASSFLESSRFGRAESDILPGQKGRVFYNGCSWQAYCDGEVAIHKGQRVLITARHSLHLFAVSLETSFESLV
mgnify:FL=1